jgi:hypothetical protein
MKQTTATKSEETSVQSDLEARNSYQKKIRNDDRVWAAMQNQFLSFVCCYQHWWRECEKTSTGETNLRKANLSADDISKSGTRRYALHKAENSRARKERKKTKRECNLQKLVPWRVPKNSDRFSQQHWWRECNPQSRTRELKRKSEPQKGGKERKAWEQCNGTRTKTRERRETNKRSAAKRQEQRC